MHHLPRTIDEALAESTRTSICFNHTMTASADVTMPDHRVGDRVQVHRPDEETSAGVLVEDFAWATPAVESLGRDWAPPRRWAVALDIGTLVFADDADIEAIH